MLNIINVINDIDKKISTEMYLKQPEFTDSSCGLFTKNKEIIQKLKKKQVIQDIFTEMN